MTEETAKAPWRAGGKRRRSLFFFREAARRLAWMRSIEALDGRSGAEFGRHIEDEARAVRLSGAMKVMIRRKEALVVMSLEHYQELLDVRAMLVELARSEGQQVLQTADHAFDQLLAQMQTREHQSGMDAVFGASAKELKASFKPGLTESSGG